VFREFDLRLTEHETRSTNLSTLQNLNDKQKVELNAAFTACTAVTSLLETVTDAAEIAARMATIMLSTARSSFDEFQNARNSGQSLYILMKSISWGRGAANPNIRGEILLATV
jgi:UDP-N-acetylmuramoylalanine-D-glutamate ligase